MAFNRSSPITLNPCVKSVYTQNFSIIGSPLPPPPVGGDFLLLDETDFLLLDGTNFLLL